MPRRSRAIALSTNLRSLVFYSAIVGLLLSSCSESKVSQCQKLLSATNSLEPLNREFQAEMKSLQKNARPKDVMEVKSMLNKTSTIFKNTANKFIKIGQDTISLDLSDEKIKAWKIQYVKLLDKYQVSLTSLSNLLLNTTQVNKVSEFPSKFQKLERDGDRLFQELPKLDAEKQKLDREIKLYCQSK